MSAPPKVGDKITAVNNPGYALGFHADSSDFVFREEGFFLWQNRKNSTDRVWLGINSEGISWIRGWHKYASEEVEALLTAYALST